MFSRNFVNVSHVGRELALPERVKNFTHITTCVYIMFRNSVSHSFIMHAYSMLCPDYNHTYNSSWCVLKSYLPAQDSILHAIQYRLAPKRDFYAGCCAMMYIPLSWVFAEEYESWEFLSLVSFREWHKYCSFTKHKKVKNGIRVPRIPWNPLLTAKRVFKSDPNSLPTAMFSKHVHNFVLTIEVFVTRVSPAE